MEFKQAMITLIACGVVYTAILILTRIFGLRSFSKMSASDFAMTIAVGSVLASTVTSPEPKIISGITSLSCLFFFQWILAYVRRKSNRIGRHLDNEPLLLMVNGNILPSNLQKANVTKSDVYAKLRQANVKNFKEVKAVVFETTGDISVLHSQESDHKWDSEIFSDVRDSEKIMS